MDGVTPRIVAGPAGPGVLPNYVCEARLLTFRAPYPLRLGEGFRVGHVFAVATTVALAVGDTVEGMVQGVFWLPKVGQAWVPGVAVYWDNLQRRVTLTERDGPIDHKFIGYGLNTSTVEDSTGIVIIGIAGTDKALHGAIISAGGVP